MNRLHEPLLRDLLETADLAECRNRSLERMLSASRARRRRRHLTWASLGLLVPMLWWGAHDVSQRVHGPVPVAKLAQPSLPVAPAAPSVKVELITTDELLALFPDRPLALIGRPGNQTLVFLDEPEPTW